MSTGVMKPQNLTAAEILDRARELVPRLRDRLAEGAELRRLPDETVTDAAEAGLTGLLLPRSLGGGGGDARDFIELIRILASGDPSAAWTLGFYTLHSWLVARFPAQAQADVFRDGRHPRISFVGRPPGQAVPADGGHVITGSWGYATGIMHADYVLIPAIVDGDEAQSLFIVPTSQVTIHDTWDMSGMKATGSNDITITGEFVPAHMRVDFDVFVSRENAGSALHPEAIYSVALNDVIMFLFPALAVGAAGAMLDDFRELLERHKAAFSPLAAADSVPGQLRYARALSALRLAQARLECSLDESIASNAASPAPLSDELRAMLKLDCLSVGRQAWECVELVVRGSGTAIFRSGNITQRYLRDIHTLLSHVTIDEDGMQAKAGQILLGRATEPNPSQVFV